MNKFISLFLLVVVALEGANAFTTNSNSRAHMLTQQPNVADMPSHQPSSSTMLNLKVKVDPDAKTKNSAGNAKAAAYGGSIAVAALLPIAFLVWSALSKGN